MRDDRGDERWIGGCREGLDDALDLGCKRWRDGSDQWDEVGDLAEDTPDLGWELGKDALDFSWNQVIWDLSVLDDSSAANSGKRSNDEVLELHCEDIYISICILNNDIYILI